MNVWQAIGGLLATAILAGPAAAAPAWIEVTGAGPEARAISDTSACPSLVIDGQRRSMRVRAGPDAAFPNVLCVAPIPAGATRILVQGERLPTPVAKPKRLVILGDSGCRLKGPVVQQCNDPSGWPFARVAAMAAREKPDLVIHVGDYYYRETPCPAGDAGCAASPYGDRWPTWKAELFEPAAPLLAAAPWVFVRGNHEDCRRGGAGWFRLLDAAPKPKTCPAASDPFQARIAGARLIVLDSADTEDATAPPDLVAAFEKDLDVVRTGGPPAWIVTHRPIWFARRSGEVLSDGPVNATERAAARNSNMTAVQLVLSGHVHNFTSLDFGASRPAQLIVGTGGDLMDVNDTPPPASGLAQVDGRRARAFTIGRFGYLMFERRAGEWRGWFKDANGKVAAICRLRGQSLSCRAA